MSGNNSLQYGPLPAYTLSADGSALYLPTRASKGVKAIKTSKTRTHNIPPPR